MSSGRTSTQDQAALPLLDIVGAKTLASDLYAMSDDPDTARSASSAAPKKRTLEELMRESDENEAPTKRRRAAGGGHDAGVGVQKSTSGAGQKSTPNELASDLRPRKSKFRRPLAEYTGSDETKDIHLEDFMDSTVSVEHLNEEKLAVYLNQLHEKWILNGSSTMDVIRSHAYSMWGLEENIAPDPMAVHKQYRFNIFQAMRLYMQFVRLNLVGHKDNDSLLATKMFAKIFEAISVYYDLLMAEQRIRAINANKYVEVPSEISLFKFSFHDFTRNNSFQNLIIFLLRKAFEFGYRRYGEHCYKQIYTKEGMATHAWEPVCTIKEFIYRMVDKNTNYEQWCNLTSSQSNERAVLGYLQNSEDAEFPALKPIRHIFSFRDGLYDAFKDEFYDYEVSPQPPSIVAAKHFRRRFRIEEYRSARGPDGKVHWSAVPTPNFDKIMHGQKWPREVMNMWYAMMGRCIYPVGARDDYQVIAFVKGVAKSGKSTLGKVAANFYNPADVGTMSSNMEKQFGMSTLFHKFLFICYEVKGNFRVDQAEFQSVISGEDVYLAVKNKDPVMGPWKVPGLLFGNETANWVDSAGSMARRILPFECNHAVQEADPNLLKNILRKEMPAIIYKANMAYNELIGVSSSELWAHVPTYFKESQANMSAAISPLRAFFKGCDSLVVDADWYMPWSELWSMHNDFVQENGFKKPRITTDYYTAVFKEIGIRLERGTTRTWKGVKVQDTWAVGIGPRVMPAGDRVDVPMDEDDAAV